MSKERAINQAKEYTEKYGVFSYVHAAGFGYQVRMTGIENPVSSIDIGPVIASFRPVGA